MQVEAQGVCGCQGTSPNKDALVLLSSGYTNWILTAAPAQHTCEGCISTVSFVLFVVKSNDQLRLCVNYRRFNHITKRNRYFIFLIEKILARMQNCKYLIKLNIISIFNKFRMSEKNEKLITFVIFMKSYKYRILFFELINELAS